MAGKRRFKRQRTSSGVLIVGNAPGGRYRQQAVQQIRQLPPGVHRQYVAHDAWCNIWLGRACNCEPDVWLEKQEEP